MTLRARRSYAEPGSGRHRLSALGRGYSFFVRSAKFALPILALVIVALVIARLQKDPMREELASLPPEEKTLPGQVELVEARYEGVDEKNQPYTLTADKAAQLPENENLILLERPRADITLEDGSWIALHAQSGTFDKQAFLLNLTGDVRLFHDRGYELSTTKMSADLQKRAATAPAQTSVQGPMGRITGARMDVAPGGEKIIFQGPATLILHDLSGKGRG